MKSKDQLVKRRQIEIVDTKNTDTRGVIVLYNQRPPNIRRPAPDTQIRPHVSSAVLTSSSVKMRPIKCVNLHNFLHAAHLDKRLKPY